jgi:hypothetical protein
MAGGQDHVQQAWPAREKELQLRLRIRRDQLMQIVDHEHDGFVERFEVRDEAPHEPVAVELRRRRDLLHDALLADRGAQLLDDRHRSVASRSWRSTSTGRSCAETRFIDPRAKQHGLPGAGRGRDERYAGGDSGRQALVQRSSCDDASSADADGLLRSTHAVIVARGLARRSWKLAARSASTRLTTG